MERLLQAGKLSLVIDLDQTILHATQDQTVEQWFHDPAKLEYVRDLHRVILEDRRTYYVKLRYEKSWRTSFDPMW